jgi:transcriptional regulator with XRE-family HTH domain
LTFRRSGSVPAVRKEKRMYYDQHVCGARIQELRKSKGYTQEALAEAIDIDAKRISKIERGVISASYNDMILFSEFFGVTLDYLIIGKRQDVDALKKKVQDAITQLQEALM